MPELTVSAPEGAEFIYDEVKTERGQKSLGEWPLLVWKDIDAAVAHYGTAEILDILDGTSLRVSFQSINRRMALAGKSQDEAAKAQVDFKPGKRGGGASTPASRVSRQARAAVEKGGVNADAVAAFLERLARGEISEDQLASIGG
jgi:hypothetical protein